MRKKWLWIAGTLAGFALVAGVRWMPGWYWSLRTANPVRSGARLAAEEGCFSCHAPLGRDQHANPGNQWKSVPSFFRGNLMMYVKSPDQVENFITYGRPKAPSKSGAEPYHAKQLFHMPAFKGRLSRKQIHELALFVIAADGYLVPDSGPVADGFTASRKFGCESCHGVGGSGGLPNPRSFTGSVPGWTGPAFSHLVQNRKEFDQWVLDGRSKRFSENRAASFFLDRATLHMPAFKEVLSKNDVDDLWGYVNWLRSNRGPILSSAGSGG